jgi:hypothetical protein
MASPAPYSQRGLIVATCFFVPIFLYFSALERGRSMPSARIIVPAGLAYAVLGYFAAGAFLRWMDKKRTD